MEYYVGIYFSLFHPQWPIVHRPSFQLGQQPPLTLITTVMIGLWVTGERVARSKAEMMHDKLLTLLGSRIIRITSRNPALKTYSSQDWKSPALGREWPICRK
ncbi:hypothetical protein BDW66DRAFT_146309 [Aspergillus desertorum]